MITIANRLARLIAFFSGFFIPRIITGLQYRNISVIMIFILCGFLLLGNSPQKKSEPIVRPNSSPTYYPPVEIASQNRSVCPSTYGTDEASITYVESSGEECLTPRQACGVESAARANPHMKIRIYTNAIAAIFHDGHRHSWSQRLLANRPGRIRSCSFNRLLEAKHNAKFFEEDLIDQWIRPNLSPNVDLDQFTKGYPSRMKQINQALRLILLEKYGGYYLDFENLVLQPLNCLRNTFTVVQLDDDGGSYGMDNGILAMDAGHPFLKFVVQNLKHEFRSKGWSSLGPSDLMDIFLEFCDKDDWRLLEFSHKYRCHGNKSEMALIHPNSMYFSVKFNQKKQFYFHDSSTSLSSDDDDTDYLKEQLQSVYAIRFHPVYIKVQPGSLYGRLASHYCPSVWNLAQNEEIVQYGF